MPLIASSARGVASPRTLTLWQSSSNSSISRSIWAPAASGVPTSSASAAACRSRSWLAIPTWYVRSPAAAACALLISRSVTPLMAETTTTT